MKTQQDQELLEQYKKLSGRKVEEDGEWIIIHQNDGKVKRLKYKPAIKDMQNYVNAKTGNAGVNIPASFFKITKSKQLKKQWKSISCSITMEEYEELSKYLKQSGIKVNEFMRSIILKVLNNIRK